MEIYEDVCLLHYVSYYLKTYPALRTDSLSIKVFCLFLQIAGDKGG